MPKRIERYQDYELPEERTIRGYWPRSWLRDA